MTQTYVSGREVYLATKLTPAWTVNLTADPWITSWRIYFKNDFQEEWINFTWVSSSWSYYVLSWVTRDINPVTIPMTSSSTGKTWLATQIWIIVAMHDQLWDRQQWWPFASLTTTELNARIWKEVWETFYNSSLWTLVYWNGSSYQPFWTWTFVNATTTSSWWVEIATPAESKSATDTWSTWPLVVTPSDIAKNTQSWTFVYWTDSWWDDTYVVALTPILASYTTGQRLTFIPTTANTWACSVDFWPWVKNIKTQDWNDPQSWVIRASKPVTWTYDWTNFIIDNEDFATASNKWIVEMATDWEATTWTDETRYINPKQAKDNYLLLAKWVNFTRDLTVASWTQTVTHSLWKTPKMITINWYYATWTSRCTSYWVYDWDTTTTYVWNASWDWWQDTTNIIVIRTNAWTDNQVATISNITTTTFDLVWTKTWSPTWTAFFTSTIIA